MSEWVLWGVGDSASRAEGSLASHFQSLTAHAAEAAAMRPVPEAVVACAKPAAAARHREEEHPRSIGSVRSLEREVSRKHYKPWGEVAGRYKAKMSQVGKMCKRRTAVVFWYSSRVGGVHLIKYLQLSTAPTLHACPSCSPGCSRGRRPPRRRCALHACGPGQEQPQQR